MAPSASPIAACSFLISMKKNPTQAQPPATEDAAWWLQNRKLLEKELRAAIHAGETITAEELRRRIEASKQRRAPVVALRIPEADLTLARKQAKQKGLPYQTYIKSLLHQALAQCEKQKAG
jgi:predicted DNA binding CopG/RHH family protein